MDQLVSVILAINKVHRPPQIALDCKPGLGKLNQVYDPNLYSIHIFVDYKCRNGQCLPDRHGRIYALLQLMPVI